MNRPPPPPPPRGDQWKIDRFRCQLESMLEITPGSGVYLATDLTEDEYGWFSGRQTSGTYVPERHEPKVVHRPTPVTWGQTKHGKIVSLVGGRLESEEKADPIVKVGGEGWPVWVAPSPGDFVVMKAQAAKTKKQAASAVAAVEFD